MTPTTHKPFVPPNVQMKEFTLRAVLLGLVMCVILGAANAYLGLRAGQTIAATYPAAVIGVERSASGVFRRYCGVCTVTPYTTPFFGFKK